MWHEDQIVWVDAEEMVIVARETRGQDVWIKLCRPGHPNGWWVTETTLDQWIREGRADRGPTFTKSY